MNIVIISPGYPYKENNAYSFVKQLVDAFSKQGVTCCVVAPNHVLRQRRICPYKEVVKRDGYAPVTIYRPNMLSFSNWTFFGKPVSQLYRKHVVRKVLNKLPQVPDLVYGHFWRSGWLGFDYARENDLPLFVATGESCIAKMFPYSVENQPFYNYVKGVVAVSEKNKRESVDLRYTTSEKCQVFPNGVDLTLFRPIPQTEARAKLHIPKDDFVVIFVGSFIERKGADRVSEAIGRIVGKKVNSIFVGEEGACRPSCDGIIYCGKVSHEDLPLYLCASDAFVLPTLSEGCCNAIVEAMACGLPVISSDRDFNDALLGEDNSIRIDPMDIDALSDAIVKLRDDESLRLQMGQRSLERAKSLGIEERSRAILRFFSSKMN